MRKRDSGKMRNGQTTERSPLFHFSIFPLWAVEKP